MNIIEVNKLRLGYIKEFYALYDVNFEVKKGEKLAIVGQGDSGKTSLLRIIAGLQEKTTGDITINDVPIENVDYSAVNMGYIPAVPILVDSKKASWHVKFLLRTRGVSRAESKIIAFKVLNEYKLVDCKVKHYTLFQKRILQFALLSLRSLEIVVVDDLMQGLSSEEQKIIYDMVKKLINVEGTTSIVAVSDVNLAKELCDRAIFLRLGSIISEVDYYDKK